MKKLLFVLIFVASAALLVSAQQSGANTSRKLGTAYCDANFVGEPISFSMSTDLRLDDLIFQIHKRFGVNFLMGEGIKELPINIRSGSIPWNTLLSSQLFMSGVRARCIGDNTIELIRNETLPKLQDNAEVYTRFIKLKFLQPTTGGSVDVAGRSNQQGGGGGGGGGQGGGCQGGGGQGGGGTQGGGGGAGGGTQGCGNFERLITEIEKILGIQRSGGGVGGSSDGGEAKRSNRSVSQIPGRNMLVVRATNEELDLINQIIEKADRPPFQVVIKGLVYTANVNKLRDIGVETKITAATADGRTGGGVLGNAISGAGSVFDFSTLLGTVDFNIQASALQQNGTISIKSRPFAIVLDGDSTELEVGRQIPVLTQGSVVGNGVGQLQFIGASNLLSVTPHVIDDDNGKPIAVNLELQLESNEVDTSVVSQGVPSVNRRSIQSRLILTQDKTVILGGFTVDQLSDSTSKTPGLGDIPLLGYLFKRKVRSDQINRLYFALSVTVIPYGEVLEPVKVPGATTDVPGVLPTTLKTEERTKDQ